MKRGLSLNTPAPKSVKREAVVRRSGARRYCARAAGGSLNSG